ncbi:Arylacetamide deacetylase [Scheffersomyces xylosifermentans]|uniref:Arylacetamide deacetylase n=1 Tax=Scheffersomyces xylosifermentans TaxID=1304137 RepID=UPI00315DC235
MVTVGFLWKVITIPVTALRAVIQYYTTGTIYSNTNREFKNSLWKNVHLSIESHLAGDLQKEDVRFFVYRPITKVIAKFKNHPLALAVNNFGKKLDDYGYWLVQNEAPEGQEREDVIVYLHGGGYLLSMFESQFVTFLAFYFALKPETRKKVSILVVDYSLTMHDKIYPTQLWETLHTYNSLLEKGYKNIHLIGDSAGTHMALSVGRYIAYPEEAKEQFKHFPEFDFNFSHQPFPQPKSMVLISPWVQPCTMPTFPPKHGVNVDGDLGARETLMGDFYVGDLDKELINNFLTFTNTNYEDHWANVECINNGNTLMIAGEREILRDSIEDFFEIINKEGKVDYQVDEGGIHAAMVYVESLDYLGTKGAQRALDGDFNDKFSYNLCTKFYEDRV